jgi:ATP-dependent DNA helicase RecQ
VPPDRALHPLNTARGVEAPLSPELQAALARFGHSAFRPGQREAIETLLTLGRLLLVAPTGGGKSLTYQIPASLLPGTTLVVSPLIALMQDQVVALERCGVPATFLASTLAAQESRRRMVGIARGEYDLVYVAPERLVLEGFRSLVGDLDCGLLAVDEAHCISEWGHDFRPEYMQIGEMVELLPKARVLACTATATPVVRDEIIERLGLPPDTPQILRGFARPNLSLRAIEVRGDRGRSAAVDAALAEALGAPGTGRGTAIVYSPTRRAAEEEAGRLAAAGWRCRFYHAGLDGVTRDAVQQEFMGGALEAVVATNAFGMGIDRPDVRAVVHLGPPGSLEAYYQEVGRAGRDGERALGLLLYASADLPLRRRLIESAADGAAPAPEVVEHRWNLFLELVRWADGGSCRHDAILRYFGDEDEALAGCGICDVCSLLAEGGEESQDPETVALVVRKALSGVARIHGRYGLGAALHLLRGVRDERLARAGLDRTRTFGVLAECGEEWLQRLLRRLVTAGWVDFHWVEFGAGRGAVAVLTEAGAQVMRGERPVRLVLPSQRAVPSDAPPALRRPRGGGRARPVASGDLQPGDRALMEALRAHRLEVARAQGVPPYVVAHDRTLHDLVLLKPRTRDELLLAHGVGPAKADRYGEGMLAVLRRHREAAH